MEEPGMRATDKVMVRSLKESDLEVIIRIDEKTMGRSRGQYYGDKIQRVLRDQKLTTSLVAELDDHPVGFLFATLHYGEFGRPEPVAVLDSIGVDPEYQKRHVGEALLGQLAMNLKALHVSRLETQVDWAQRELLSFLAHQGFEPAPRFSLQLKLED